MVCLISQSSTSLGQIRIATPPRPAASIPSASRHEECLTSHPGSNVQSSVKTSLGRPWVSCKHKICPFFANFPRNLRERARLAGSPIKSPLQFQVPTLNEPHKGPRGMADLLGPLFPFIEDHFGKCRFHLCQFNIEPNPPRLFPTNPGLIFRQNFDSANRFFVCPNLGFCPL